jgi:S1-C subfamily serine protease
MNSRFVSPILALLSLSLGACEKQKPILIVEATPASSAASVVASPVAKTEPSMQAAIAPSPTPLKRLTLVQIAAKISPSVVTLTAYNSQGQKLKMGTGFFVHQSGIIATNWHVISGANKVTATTSTGEVLDVPIVGRYNPKLDLALCSVEGGRRNFPSFTIYRKQLPPMGTSIAVLGNPEGLEQSFSEGIVSAIRPDDAGTLIQITAPISPGSSGSPVVDSTGSLVGVAGATYREGQNLNFARSAPDLAAIWHDLRPQTFPEVATERFKAFSTCEVARKFLEIYKTNNVREKVRLAFALRAAFPDVATSYILTGGELHELQDYQNAIAELEQARLLDPEDPIPWQGLGEIYGKLGQSNRSRECFRRAKELHNAEASNSKPSGAIIARTQPYQPHGPAAPSWTPSLFPPLPGESSAPSWTPRISTPKSSPHPFSSLFPPLPAAPDR